MMTKHKRFLALLLAVVMAIGMVPTAFAEENETEPSTTETTAAATGATEATEAATEATEETKATTTEPAGPQVGDRIWIKSQSAVYKKSSADSVSHTLIGNYEVKITNIITDGDGAPTWYEFEFTSLGIGEAALLIGGYKYVLVENTSVEKPAETKPQETEGTEETTPTTEATTPVDENACNCGENAPESLAQHADSCPRKAYVKSLFEGKTAEEIYANWESYDVGLRTDILGMLEVYDSVKWKALNALIKNSEEDFPTVEIGDVSLAIAVPEDAFPEGTKSTVTEQNGGDFESAIEEVLKGLDPDSNILKLIAMDISFACNGEEVQPSIPVTLTFNIDASDIPSDAESAYVFHIADSGEAEIVGEFPEIGNSEALVLEINAFKFSSYVLGFTGKTYDPILLSTKLSGNSRYSLVEFPVNLFNYEMDAFNSYISGLEGADNYLKFVTDSESFLPNSGGAYATQGIVKKTLKNGYPEMAFGYDNGAYIFNTTEYAGKTVAANKKFEFIYDSQTGYYEYNSALNHAQLSGDKVRLYTDTLSPYNYANRRACKSQHRQTPSP